MPGSDEKMDYDDDDIDQEYIDTDKSESGSSDSASDEDDGELDVAESEQRRSECVEKMSDLENQFYQLKEHLFNEKTAQIAEKLKEVELEIAKEYRDPVLRFEENMKKRLRIAEIRLELQQKNLENKYECEKRAALQTFENDKKLIEDTTLQEFQDKIYRLQQDRHNTDITSDLLGESQPTKKKRQSTSILNDKRRRPVVVSGPYIVYNLSNERINEDYRAIKMALKQIREEPLLPLSIATR